MFWVCMELVWGNFGGEMVYVVIFELEGEFLGIDMLELIEEGGGWGKYSG